MDPLLGELRPTSSTVARFGVVMGEGSARRVLIDGVEQSARWAKGFYPKHGDPVLVLVSAAPTGQSSNLVLCATQGSPDALVEPPSEASVTAVPAASPTITVSAGGTSYTAKIVGAAPVVGDLVFLEWRSGVAYAVGVIGSTPAPEPPPPPAPIIPPPPPPSAATTGTLAVPALDSGTFAVGAGRWDSYYKQHVTQGSWGGKSYSGAWFYGTSAQQLAGRTITGIRMQLASRRRVGNYNTPVALRLHAHTSPNRPGGDVPRVAGPYIVNIGPGSPGGWVDLPLDFAPALVAGGGISIVGGDYASITGRGEDPSSGLLHIDWSS